MELDIPTADVLYYLLHDGLVAMIEGNTIGLLLDEHFVAEHRGKVFTAS